MTAPLLPPQSIESEQAVLGALLIQNSLGDDLAGVLIADDFYRADHRLIYTLITQLITAQQPADFITLCDSARRLGKLEDCGGQSYIGSLVGDLGSTVNFLRYAEIVREKSILRHWLTSLCKSTPHSG